MRKRQKAEAETVGTLFNERAKATQALHTESDRAVVLITAAYLDDALAGLIRSALIDEPALVDELLGVDRPLGTFSARIKLAYCLGLISRATLRDLELIRRIRNDFAHSRCILRFGTRGVKERCMQLRCPLITAGSVVPDWSDPRVRFIEATEWLGNVFQARDRELSRPRYAADRP